MHNAIYLAFQNQYLSFILEQVGVMFDPISSFVNFSN